MMETPKPKFAVDHWWETAARQCAGTEIAGAKCDGSANCVHNLAFPYRQCISRAGVHACPAGYDTGERFVMYRKDGVQEGRGCTDCACGAPVGGACVGRLRVFEDGTCGKLIDDKAISSIEDVCTDLAMPGVALGSKEVVDVAYVPGTCAGNGGEPFGEAQPDDDQGRTFCCLSAFPSE